MYRVTSNIIGVPQIVVQQTQAAWAAFLGSSASSVPGMQPGMKVTAADRIFGEATFILAYGVASLQVGDAVTIGAGYATTRTVAASRGIVGISMCANTDTGALSWFCIQGQVPVRAATMAVNLPLYLTATPGALSSAVVATNQVTAAASVLAASGTVTTKQIQTVNGSTDIMVPDTDGLYIGQLVTGTGVGAAAAISAIGDGGVMLGLNGPKKNHITVTVASTATGSVTGTFAHPAGFGTANLAFPAASGLG